MTHTRKRAHTLTSLAASSSLLQVAGVAEEWGWLEVGVVGGAEGRPGWVVGWLAGCQREAVIEGGCERSRWISCVL